MRRRWTPDSMARTAWSNWFASNWGLLHDDGFREFMGGEGKEYMQLTGSAGEAVHHAWWHVKGYARPNSNLVIAERGQALTSEEREAFLNRMRVQQHALAGLQPLLGDEEAARADY
jgi:hypothetical protein